MMTPLRDPIFLLGSHKSGTSLLRSLLDGCPDCFAVPVETHFFQFMGYWVDYPFRRALPAALTVDQMIDNLMAHVRLSNQRASKTSDSSLKGAWDETRFEQTLRSRGSAAYDREGIKGLMTAYIQAIYQSLYGSPMPDCRVVEKSVEHAEYAVVLKKLWPKARFVHIVRNPYAALAAIRRYTAGSGYPFLGRHLAVLKNTCYYLYKNPLCIDNYKVIRYEDLVSSPEDTMAGVADFLDLPFTDTLLTPSVMAAPWEGNSTVDKGFTGISTRPLTAWKTDITPLEIHLVNRLFAHVLSDFGYAPMPVTGSVYRPCAGESMKIYAANRMLLKTVDKCL